MLLFTTGNIFGLGSLDSGISILGDGTSSILIIELEKPPFNLDFKGNLPIDVNPHTIFASISIPGQLGITSSVHVSLEPDKRSILLEPAIILPIGSSISISGITFVYQGK